MTEEAAPLPAERGSEEHRVQFRAQGLRTLQWGLALLLARRDAEFATELYHRQASERKELFSGFSGLELAKGY